MAEEILIAELRAATAKFDRDLKKAAAIADRSAKDMAKGLGKIENAVKDLPRNFKKFNDELKKTERETKRAGQAAQSYSNSLGFLKNAALAYLSINFASKLASEVAGMARLSERLQGVNLQFENAFGSAKAAADAFEFVRQTSQRLAQDTIENSQQFARMALAAKGTKLEGDALKFVYLGLAEAAAALKVEQADFNRVLAQVNQGILKQRFDTEDLRTASENGIPILLALQKALNLSGTELFKAIEQGKIGINELVLGVGELRNQFSGLATQSTQNVSASFRRMFDEIKLSVADFTTELFNTGEVDNFVQTVQTSFNNLKNSLDKSQLLEFFKSLVVLAENAIKIINDMIGILLEMAKVVRGVSQAISEFAEKQSPDSALGKAIVFLEGKFADADKALADFLRTLGVSIPSVDKAKSPIVEMGQALTELEEQYILFGDEVPKALEKGQIDSKKILDNIKSDIRSTSNEIAKQRLLLAELTSDAVGALLDPPPDSQWLTELEVQQKLALKDWENYASSVEALLGDVDYVPTEDNADKQLREFQNFLDRAKENVQDTLGDVFTDVFRGQITSVNQIAGSFKDIITGVSGQIIGSVGGAALFNTMEQLIVGNLREGELGGLAGALGELIGGVNNSTQLFEDLGAAIEGLTAGLAAGQITGSLAGALGASKTVQAVAASIGSAVSTGLAVGQSSGNVYAAVGAAIASGMLTALPTILGGPKAGRVNLVTRDGRFSNFGQTEGGTQAARSPFGLVGLLDEGTNRVDSGGFPQMIAEIDRQIARLITAQQRQLVARRFQNVSIVEKSKDPEILAAEVIQDRLFDAISAIAGNRVATNVVGERGTGSQQNLEQMQQRATEALQIFKIIEEFNVGPLSEVGQAIKQINQQFDDLIISAEAFGISTADIEKERQRLLTQITSDFNANIAQRILEIENPIEAQFAELERRQQEELANAKDANANIIELDRLHSLERERLAEQLADANNDVNQSLEETARRLEALRPQMEQFVRGGLSPVAQQLAALEDRFQALRDEALALGEPIHALTMAYQQQATALRFQTRNAFHLALSQITDPFQASLLQISTQVREFQRQAEAGIIPQPLIDQFDAVSRSRARFQHALNLGSGATTPEEQFDEIIRAFINAGSPLTDTQRQLNDLMREFTQLENALKFLGRPTDELVAAYEKQRDAILALADAATDTTQALIDEALSIINGGNRSPIHQVADSFEAFIRAGNPLSATNQALFDLTETFLNLSDAASLLGITTDDLEASYLEQAAAIREQLIADIDASLEPRRQVLDQADQFLNRLRIGDELPNSLRFAEAQRQFRDVALSGDLQAALAAAEQLRTIARESFGSTSSFFDVRNDIISTIESLREQEQAAIEAERARLLAEEGRQIELVSLQRSSLDSLQRIQSSNNDVARLTEQLLREQRNGNERLDRLESLMRQVLA